MSSTAADVHPALPPIRTTAAAPEPACSSAASSSTVPAPDAESVALPAPEEKHQQQQQKQQGEAGRSEAHQEKEKEVEVEAEPTTPTSEGSRLRPPAECPPAPRRPAWTRPLQRTTPAKRKLPSSAAAPRAFFPVARDLTTVFQALPPPKKRTIRAG